MFYLLHFRHESDGRGTQSLARAFPTNGNGAHGKVAAPAPDSLFSQGAVKTSAKGNYLAAVNVIFFFFPLTNIVLSFVQPGSGTVSLFGIDPTHPSNIQMIGEPIGSGGDFPISVDFNAAGDRLCVLNGGEVNGVKCFSVNAKSGLASIAGTVRSTKLNQTTPATGPASTNTQVLFSANGTQLYAGVKGTPTAPGFLAVWDIATDGSLSTNFKPVALPHGGALPFGMNLIPGANAVFATDPALGERHSASRPFFN
jgi:hypothetical protein